MIIDLEKYDGDAELTAQVCVVGAGAVGIPLAVALANAGQDVVLLEGGGESFETSSQNLQRGESVGHPFQNIEVGRYRVLGGTTIFWGGQVVPFDAHVTGARPWLGYEAWPIPPQELETYYQRAWRHVGLEEARFEPEEVWERLRIEPPRFGDDLHVVLTHWIRIRNFAKLYAKTLRDANGPRVILHANAVALEAGGENGAVRAVHARTLGGRQLMVRARRVVLANGTLESVRLLKQPLAGGAPAPWAESPWLGSPLIDHLDCIAGDVKILDYRRFHEIFDNVYMDGFKYFPKIRLGPETQRKEGLVDVAAQFFYRTRMSEHLEYLKLFLRSLREGGSQVPLRALPAHALAVLGVVVPLAMRYFRDRRSFKPQDAEVALAFNCEQRPCARSRIGLSEQTDALGMRRLSIDWQIDGSELRSMRIFGQAVKRQFEQARLAQIDLDPRVVNEDPSFITALHDAIHQMGTTRMSSNASDGFVDSDLRVHACPNLHVAGAAVFPSTGFANPTFTAIALTLRLADHLVEVASNG